MAISDAQRRADAIMAWAHAQIDAAEMSAERDGEHVTGVAFVVYGESKFTIAYHGEEKRTLMHGLKTLYDLLKGVRQRNDTLDS